MAEEMSRMVCLGILTGISVTDIRIRKIPMAVLIIGNAGAALFQIIFRTEDLMVIAGGMGIGLFFFLVSKITEESIGYGDCFGILGLGIYLGLWKLLEVLAGTFFLLLSGSIIVLCKKRMSKKCTLPFFPFLAAGYLIWMIIG